MSRPDGIRVLLSNIQTKLEELRGLEAIVTRVNEVEETLVELQADMPEDVHGQKADEWNALKENDRDELRSRLNDVQSRVLTIESQVRGADPTEIRNLTIYSIGMFLAFLALIFLCVCKGVVPEIAVAKGSSSKADNANSNSNADTTELKSGAGVHRAYGYLLLLVLGGFGACVRLLGSLARYLGQGSFFRSWRWYYYFMPLEGAGMGLIVCLLFAAGILSPSGGEPTGILFVYGMAGIAGMFSRNVSEKLRELCIVLFGKPSSKDAA